MGNDTGRGGFDIDGQTYTFDVGLSEQDGGAQGATNKVIDVSKSYVDDSGKQKDLTTKTKITLSQYLSKQTQGQGEATPVPNRYPIDPDYQEIATITEDGYPTLQTPGAPPPANSKSFAPSTDEYTTYTRNYSKLTSGLKKGKAPPTPNSVDGNEILSGLQGDSSYIADPGKLTGISTGGVKSIKGHKDTSNIVKPYVSAVLSVNRFAAASASNQQKAYTESVPEGAAGINPTFLKQARLGTYDANATGYSAERLATIGPLLTMRAGKELGAASPGANPNDGGLQAKAILPGMGQIGITRIEQQVLQASDVLATLTTDDLEDVFVINPNEYSWGQLNNVNDPYTGTDAIGMLALSTALIAGVELLIDGLSVLLGAITPSTKSATRDAQGRYSLGEYLQGGKQSRKAARGGVGGALSALSSLNFGALLGIQPTNYPFKRALTSGMNAFFGMPDSEGGIGLNQLAGALKAQLAGALKASADSPGFNIVVCRTIIRSSIVIVDKMKKIGGNFMNAVTQILSLIDTIRSSKIIAACNIFASLGDTVLSTYENIIDVDTNNVKLSSMDAKEDGNAVSKNRLQGVLKLAWASNRAPSTMLLPNSIIAASLSVKEMGQFVKLGMQHDPYSLNETRVVTANDSGRISPELAYEFEQKLEASYVPFYFHDIRTNEMISFHAFLASLTDDYTPAYDKVDGLGRVEGVKIYKSTERKIGMSFYVVATSMLDLDDMYVKINKLTTLLYPQYTKGVQLSSADNNYNFVQPFSQLVGASPLIRLRLGDLIRSNYSIFALGRLFGMGNPEFKVDGQGFADAAQIDQAVVDEYATKMKALLQKPDGDAKFFPDWGHSYPLVPEGSALGANVPSPPSPVGGSNKGPKFAPDFDPFTSDKQGCFIVKVKKIDPDNPFMVIGEVALNDDQDYLANTPGIKKYVNDTFNNSERPLLKFIGGTYKFPMTCLSPTPVTRMKLKKKIKGFESLTPNSEFGKKLSKFLHPNNNAIAKSFQDTGGKGLAGFIESMNFDWYDKTTWEIEPGRTAPKMCKITLSFSPVHDISPGIDHNGFNRAPIYPVGGMRQGSMPYKKGQ